MEDGNANRYLPLHKAALSGEWSTAERIFDTDSGAMTCTFAGVKDTALHVAISTGKSIEFVKKLVEKMPANSLTAANIWGSTPLHYAAIAGNTEAARILVAKNPALTQTRNKRNDTPLHVAASNAHKDTVLYLFSVTLDESPSPFQDKDGVRLINSLILADFYSIAIELLKQKPKLASARDDWGFAALDILARKPKAFDSGSGLGRFQRLLFHCCRKNSSADFANRDVESQDQNKSNQFPFQMQKQAKELLRLLISEASKAPADEADLLVGNAMLTAATLGIHEFIKESITSCPGALQVANLEGLNVFNLAVKYRQENIFNLLQRMGTLKYFSTSVFDFAGNSMLHLAATLAPSNKISGAALQMQRELQWFKEVEKVVQPSHKETKNNMGETPNAVFTREHKTLVEQGEKWMKDTASSCATVAALVITVVFAAAFTVPGGNNSDQGIPIYLNQTSFMIFAVSDILALFSSSTSLLMFLGILTSRYSEEDFLKALPMRLSIGLITLFFSIAAMLGAFCAAFHLVLFQKVNWIAAPISLLACAPVTLFALLQFPLLVEMVSSTFGPSIFEKQSQEMLF